MGAVPILVVGSVGLDAVETPTETATEILGGAASYFCLSAALFAPVRLVGVVGEDFPLEHKQLLESRHIDLTGLQVRPGKTFRWTARYTGVRLENRERSEEHTSELQSRSDLVCRLLLEKKKKKKKQNKSINKKKYKYYN